MDFSKVLKFQAKNALNIQYPVEMKAKYILKR